MAGSINAVLDALAAVVRAALPGNVTVHAPERTMGPTTIFPVVQIYPWRLHLERTETGLWGNLMYDHPHGRGPDLWRCAILELPENPASDQQLARHALQEHVDSIRAALTAAPTLPDDLGQARVLDAADHIASDYGGQGAVIEWHRHAYMGAYITVAVQPLRRAAGTRAGNR